MAGYYGHTAAGTPMFKETRVAHSSVTIVATSNQITLNKSDVYQNNNKFYKMFLEDVKHPSYPGRTLFRVFSEYGRVGNKAATIAKYYGSRGVAASAYDTILRDKQSKGYVEIEMASASAEKILIKKKAKNTREVLSDPVLAMIATIDGMMVDYLAKNLNTPIGNISPRQVAKGVDILESLKNAITSGNRHEIINLTSEFYSHIPVTLCGPVSSNIIESLGAIQKYADMLDVMESAANQNEIKAETVQEKYDALGGIKFRALTKGGTKYKEIEKLLRKTHGANHHFNYEISNIFKVSSTPRSKGFNPHNVKTELLFHGTRKEHLMSIFANGLKKNPPSFAQITGKMFGNGIYMANTCSKSMNYCRGFSRDGSAGKNYLLVCEVATGKKKIYTSSQWNLTTPPRPYNSVWGKKGAGLLHDEFIVYHNNQVKINYVVEFEFKYQ